MTTESAPVIFDEDGLRNAITCAVLMSYIDGELHEKEWEIILRFVDAHWKKSSQEFKQFIDDVKEQIAPYLIQSVAYYGILDELVDNLIKEMTNSQKVVLLNLIEDIMIADGVLTSEESKLFETFSEKMRIR